MLNQTSNALVPVASSSSKTQKNAIEISHIWTIENFSFYLKDRVIASPPFCAGINDGVRWCLQLYPTGQGTDPDSKNWISFYLNLHTCDSGVLVKYRISILNGDHDPIQRMFIHEPVKLVQGAGWGMIKLIRRDLLYTDYHLPRDKIIVFCELTYAIDVVVIPSQGSPLRTENSESTQPKDMASELYESRMFSDVVLVVNKRDFRAHKAILASRSPVFKAMFEEDSDGSSLSRVEISDIDEETIEDLLSYIYIGKPKASATLSSKLIDAIDKYALGKASLTGAPSSVAGSSSAAPSTGEPSRRRAIQTIVIDDETTRPTVEQGPRSPSRPRQGNNPPQDDVTSPQPGTSGTSSGATKRRQPNENGPAPNGDGSEKAGKQRKSTT